MGDINCDREGSGSCARARVSVSGSVRCMSRIGLSLYLGSSSDVRASGRLNDSVIVRLG